MSNMSFIIVSLLALLISISAFSARADAKPINQNQVKFRRLPPKEFSAALGSSITIECEAGGSPPPNIHWLKDGKRIAQNDLDENQLEDGQAIQVDDVNRIALSSTRSRLFIDCAQFKDEAVYTCVAENAFSRIASHTKLNLIKPITSTVIGQSATDNELLSASEDVAAMEHQLADGQADKSSLSAVAQCLNQQQRAPEPLRIHMWTHNIVEIMKNNIILMCRSNAKRRPSNQQQQSQDAVSNNNFNLIEKLKPSPLMAEQIQAAPSAETMLVANNQQDDRRPTVSWTLPNEKMVGPEQRDKYEIMETGDLLIKDLRWADMGSYVCTVSDDQSTDSISTFVYPASVKIKSKRATFATRMVDFR